MSEPIPFGECTNVAFYGLKTDDENAVSNFYHELIDLLKSRELTPHDMAYSVESISKGWAKFPGRDKLLNQHGFSDLKSLEFFGSSPKFVGALSYVGELRCGVLPV